MFDENTQDKKKIPTSKLSSEIQIEFRAENKNKIKIDHTKIDDGTVAGLFRDKLASRAAAQNNNIISEGEIQRQITKNLKIKKIVAVKPPEHGPI